MPEKAEADRQVEEGSEQDVEEILPGYPGLARRYLATAIDGLLLIAAFFAVSALIQTETLTALRVGMVVSLFLIYEPLCTSRLCTCGQLIAGVRIRTDDQLARITVLRAYVRIIAKALLGWLSFVTIGFSDRRRAIHDITAGSVVVNASGVRNA